MCIRDSCTVVSLFENDCISRGISYLEGGTVYTVVSPHIGGLVDAANSLYAIKKIVFEEKLVSFSEFMAVLKQNWATDEALRQYALKKITYYGNNNDEADMIACLLYTSYLAASWRTRWGCLAPLFGSRLFLCKMKDTKSKASPIKDIVSAPAMFIPLMKSSVGLLPK